MLISRANDEAGELPLAAALLSMGLFILLSCIILTANHSPVARETAFMTVAKDPLPSSELMS